MEDIPHIIETSLLLLVAFLLGCILGWLLKKVRFSRTTIPLATSAAANDVGANDVVARVAAPQKSKAASASQSVNKDLSDKNSDEKDSAARPPTLDQPRNGKSDNLKKIKGVGPKIESVLNELGIFHFDQISKWDQKSVEWVDDYLSFKGRISRDGWVEQARNFSKKSGTAP